MDLDETGRVLDALVADGVRHWVAGGWGIAALVGRQTREHRDLDLLVDADDLATCLAVLVRLGYSPETDWLPVRVEYVAADRGWVDVHPVVFDATGRGVQQGLGDHVFVYPPECFTLGAIGGREVPCLTVAHQRLVHSGYELRPQDVHDLAQLAALEV